MKKKSKILVYRVGAIGDILVSLRAFNVIFNLFTAKSNEIVLFTEPTVKRGSFPTWEIVNKLNIFNSVIYYGTTRKKRYISIACLISLFHILRDIRRNKFSCLIYLAPSYRTKHQVLRDRFFFRILCGIPSSIGLDVIPQNTLSIMNQVTSNGMNYRLHESDALLLRLSKKYKNIDKQILSHPLVFSHSQPDVDYVSSIFKTFPSSNSVKWIAICPGSTRQTTRWDVNNFIAVLKLLKIKNNIFPIIFGNQDDLDLGNSIQKSLPFPIGIVAGKFTVTQSIFGFSLCKLFIGNDTGTLHMAVTSGIPCVAIFSARNPPGQWFPYGKNNIVHRVSVPCEGCALDICIQNQLKCLSEIKVIDVTNSCLKLLNP